MGLLPDLPLYLLVVKRAMHLNKSTEEVSRLFHRALRRDATQVLIRGMLDNLSVREKAQSRALQLVPKADASRYSINIEARRLIQHFKCASLV